MLRLKDEEVRHRIKKRKGQAKPVASATLGRTQGRQKQVICGGVWRLA